jgi:hypothetical protein
MLRRTLTILSLIGLLLSVALWGVSYWRIKYRMNRSQFTVWNGKVGYMAVGPQASTKKKQLPLGWVVYGLRKRGYRFSTIWTPQLSGNPFRIPFRLDIPLWMPTLLFGVSPVWLLLPFHRRRKRKKLGLCLKCGYDLRASKDRCPECGEGFPT